MKLTGTNGYVLLRELHANNGAIPSRQHAGTAHHLQRAVALGLLVADEGGCFVLTAKGKAVVLDMLPTRAPSGDDMRSKIDSWAVRS